MKISVIVPVYNVETYVDRCIESILEQTLNDFELILVDDGSTDSSGMRCEKYATIDRRIKVIHKKNAGLAEARNTGISIAEGRYISFIDSDDYVHPQFLEILYKNIVHKNADMSVCEKKEVLENAIIQKTIINQEELMMVSNSEAMICILEEGIINVVAWNKLYKKELFDNIRYPIGKLHEDEYIIHEIIFKCKNIVYSNLELYYYVQRNGSIMNSVNEKKIYDLYYALEERIQFAKKKSWEDVRKAFHKRLLKYFYDIYEIWVYNAELVNKRTRKFLRRAMWREIIKFGLFKFRCSDIILAIGFERYLLYNEIREKNIIRLKAIKVKVCNQIIRVGVKVIPVKIKNILIKIKWVKYFVKK